MPAELSEQERATLKSLLDSDPPSWMSRNFYLEDPRDPITGDPLSPGPIILLPIQERILRAALLKIGGRFRYSTIVYSTIKKSGKTRVAAGVASWFAATQGDYQEIYCMANDGKQSADRILEAIKRNVKLNPGNDWRVTKTRVSLDNGTFIEAIPCDPKGSAGSNPSLTVWSEMWGYAHEHKERLWSEMTIPSTRWGRALRWVESYAGYEGESNVLYDLYDLGVNKGYRHPSFPDVPVYINDNANMLCYWDEGDEARRLPWQNDEYYRAEATILTAAEFDRLHRNQWIQPINKALAIEWWDACKGRVPPLGPRAPCIIGADAAVTGACCAVALVSRHPARGKHATQTMVRAIRIWDPPERGMIDLTTTVEATIREWTDKYNVVEVAYDEYQLVQMMQSLRREGIKARVYRFGQVTPRYLADKQLYDMVVQKLITHSGNHRLREHVDNAMAKTTNEKFRFVTADSGDKGSRTHRPIDGLVAVSMANAECMRLIL